MKYYIISQEQIRSQNDDIIMVQGNTPSGFLKPFPTCQTCTKWKKKTRAYCRRGNDSAVCNLRIIYKTNQYNNGFKTTEPGFFCAEHTDFVEDNHDIR